MVAICSVPCKPLMPANWRLWVPVSLSHSHPNCKNKKVFLYLFLLTCLVVNGSGWGGLAHIGLVMVNYKVNAADGSIERLGLDQRWTIKFGLGWMKRQSQKRKSSVLYLWHFLFIYATLFEKGIYFILFYFWYVRSSRILQGEPRGVRFQVNREGQTREKDL